MQEPGGRDGRRQWGGGMRSCRMKVANHGLCSGSDSVTPQRTTLQDKNSATEQDLLMLWF